MSESNKHDATNQNSPKYQNEEKETEMNKDADCQRSNDKDQSLVADQERIRRLSSLSTLDTNISKYIDRVNKEESTMYYEIYPGTETVDYDFADERLNPYATNIFESTSHLIKSCLGAGILSMHVAFMHGGIWFSLANTIVLGCFVQYTMYMLVRSAQTMCNRLRVSRLSYPDIAEVAVATGPLKNCRNYSKLFRYLVDICIFIELCGTCCIYEIMIADTFKLALEAVCTTFRDLQLSGRMYILIIMTALLPVSWIRNLKYLAPISLIADLFLAICVITTMYYSAFNTSGSLSDRPAWKSTYGLYQFYGICLYSIDGITFIMPIENNMRNPRDINIVVICGMSIVTLATSLVGFFGYWGWGESCRSPVTVHMPMNTGTNVLQFMLAAMLAATFAVQFWVPFRIAWHYICRKSTFWYRGLWERIYRTLLVLVISGISIAFPDLIKMMILLGNFLLGFITFIFPACIETLVTWNDHKSGRVRWTLLKNIIITIIGLSFCSGAIYSIRS